MNRPLLLPGLPRTWRTPAELQLGADPARAVSVQLPDPRAAGVLDLLDGSRPERVILSRAAQLGVPAADTRSLLDTLRAAGLVLPASALLPPTLPDESRRRLLGEATALALSRAADESAPATVLRRRAAARVVITGRGRLGAPIAVALAEAGVGHVRPDLPGVVSPGEVAGGPLRGTDIGRPRREAVTAAVLRAAPGAQTHAVRRPSASVVVQLDHDEPVNLLAAAYAGRRQPHLAVTIRDGTAVIGPFVPATGVPCLNCLDLHRRDRDARWPGTPVARRSDAVEACAVSTLLIATGYATAEILAHLDGTTPQTRGAAAEIIAGSRIRRRSWPAHPACACTHPRRRSGR